MAEFGCLASMPIFSTTIPFACDEPPKGLHLYFVPKFAFLSRFLGLRATYHLFSSFDMASESIPEAEQGCAPGLEIVGKASRTGPPSESGRSKISVASHLSDKGLAGVPIATKHFKKGTGEPYWRFRNSSGKGCFISKQKVEELGVAWYPTDVNDPSKGVLKNPSTGRFISKDDAVTAITGSRAASDIANLNDLQDTPQVVDEDDLQDTLQVVDEEEEEESTPDRITAVNTHDTGSQHVCSFLSASILGFSLFAVGVAMTVQLGLLQVQA